MARPLSVFVNIGAKVGSAVNSAAMATERRFRRMGTTLAAAASSGERGFQRMGTTIGTVAATAERRLERLGRAARLANAETRATLHGMRDDAATFGTHVSAPAAALSGLGARMVFEWSKVGNELEAVTQMSDQARKRIEGIARSLPGNPTENLRAALDLARTGFDEKAIMGSLAVTIKLGKSDSSVDQAEAADIMTNVMKGMKMPDDTFAEIVRSSERVANNIAFGAAKSSTNVRLMGESFKYAAPMAARMGLEIEDLTAFFMTMADNGIKGSEAGVAFRSGLVRMIKPTKGAMGVLARYNMNLADYVKANKKANAADIINTLKAQGIAADGAAASIQALMNNPGLTGANLIQKISEAVAEGMGGADAMDMDKISDGVMMAMTAGVTKVDFAKFIQDGVTKGWGASEFANFFDVRQGTRLSTLWSKDAMKNIEAVKGAMERASRGQASFLDKMYLTQLEGVVGPWERIKQGFGNLMISMAESGVMDSIANGMNAIGNGMMALSKSSPGLLKFITWTILGIAVMAPLGFALAGIAAGARLLLAPLGMLAPLWGRVFGAVGAAGPQVPLMVRMGRAIAGVGRVALGARVGLAMLARLGLGALLAVTAPVAAAIAGVGLAIGFIVAKWNGIKAFFVGLREGLSKAITPETRAAFASLWTAIKSLGVVFTPVIAVVQFFWGVLKAVGGWLAGVFGPAIQTVGGWIKSVFGPAEGEKWRGWGAAAGGAIGGVVNAIGGLITKIGEAAKGMRSLFEQARNSSIINGAMSGFAGGGLGGAIAGVGNAVGQRLAGARAKGGPVRGGLPYLVGERGPEIVVPGVSGTVIPNHRLAALGAPRADALIPSTPAFRAMLPDLARGTGPAPNPLAAEASGRAGGGAPAQIIVQGATIVIQDARDPAATAREVERHLRSLANRQAALLSD